MRWGFLVFLKGKNYEAICRTLLSTVLNIFRVLRMPPVSPLGLGFLLRGFLVLF